MKVASLQLQNKRHGEAHVQSHDKWYYPNQGSSKYYPIFNWTHTMIYGMHNCCQKIVLHSYWMLWSWHLVQFHSDRYLDILCNFTVTDILKTKCLMTFVAQCCCLTVTGWEIFLFSIIFRPALGPTQPPI